MQDSFINGHVWRFQVIATQAQLGRDYKRNLERAVAEAAAEAERQPSLKETLLNGVADRLVLEAEGCETPDALFPNKLTDTKLNVLGRAAVLREAAQMLLAAR